MPRYRCKDKKYCNYGPDPIDHIMNTNCDDKWEDMRRNEKMMRSEEE